VKTQSLGYFISSEYQNGCTAVELEGVAALGIKI
jgi:hypothetical protein